MTRPASVKSTASPFVKRIDRSGKKLGLDWEVVEPSYNHRANDRYNLEDLGRLRRELREAEEQGRDSAAKKIRRELNKQLEQGLALHATWCGGCGNYLHRCKCRKMPEVSKSTEYRRRKKEAEARKYVHRLLGDIRYNLNKEGKRRAG